VPKVVTKVRHVATAPASKRDCIGVLAGVQGSMECF